MFDPRSFETELRDQLVTVEIGRCYPPHNGSHVEPPEAGDCEFEVYGDNGKITCFQVGELVAIHDLVIEHLKYAAEERET